MPRTPLANFVNDRDETSADGRQPILHLRRHDTVILARDQAAVRQRLELAAENARRNLPRSLDAAQETGSNLPIAQRPVFEVPEDTQFVLAADHLLKRRDRAAMKPFRRGRHRCRCSLRLL